MTIKKEDIRFNPAGLPEDRIRLRNRWGGDCSWRPPSFVEGSNFNPQVKIFRLEKRESYKWSGNYFEGLIDLGECG